MEKDKIQFKPLHEGMGFHPFSDGLPYAPESKAASAGSKINPSAARTTSTPMGTGAMAAGRPQFATARQLKQIQEQHQTPPSLIIPGAGPQVPTSGLRHSSPVVTKVTPAAAPKIITTQISPGPRLRTVETKPSTAAEPQPSPVEESAILRRRVFAYLMDTIIHTGFWLATNLAALFFFNFQIDAEIVQEHLTQFLMFFLVSQWLFIALQEMLFETSIGKAFFNLEFKRNHHSLFLRSIVFMAGTLFFGLGLYARIQDKLGQLQLKQKMYS
jgi:hypothetical protein